MSEALIQRTLETPINTLIVIAVIIALLILGGTGFLIYRFLPQIFKQIQQQIDTNSKLTQLVEANKTQTEMAFGSIKSNTEAQKEQTRAILEQTSAIKTQDLDFRHYQTLVSDSLANQSTQIASVVSQLAELSVVVEDVVTSIRRLVEKPSDCATAEEIATALRTEILSISQKRATSEIKPVDGKVAAS